MGFGGAGELHKTWRVISLGLICAVSGLVVATFVVAHARESALCPIVADDQELADMVHRARQENAVLKTEVEEMKRQVELLNRMMGR